MLKHGELSTREEGSSATSEAKTNNDERITSTDNVDNTARIEEIVEEISREEELTIEIGDLVYVSMGHTSVFEINEDVIKPMGEVVKIESERMIVQLFLRDNPHHSTTSRNLELIAKKNQIMDPKAKTVGIKFETGDIVAVKSATQIQYIKKSLESLGIKRSEYMDTLIGVVRGKGRAPGSLGVHFGDFENGSFTINGSDLLLIKSGKSQLSQK